MSDQEPIDSHDDDATSRIDRSIRELEALLAKPDPSRESIKNNPTEAWVTLGHQDLLLPEQQRFMLFYYRAFGIHGLHVAIAAIAQQNAEAESGNPDLRLDQLSRKRKRDSDFDPSRRAIILTSDGEESMSEDEIPDGSHVSWQVILDEFNKPVDESRILFYLASIPHEVLLGLIRGNLSEVARSARDSVQEYLRLKDVPGTYAVFAATTALHESGAGKGLNLYEFHSVIEEMKLYIDIGNPESAKLARKVDAVHGNAPELSYSQQRRYASGKKRNGVEAIQLWIDHWQDLMIQVQRWKSSDDRDTFSQSKQRMLRCLGYAGLSNNCIDRCNRHFSHTSKESPVYGLYTAVLKRRHPVDFKPSENAYQVLLSIREEDVCIGELIVTVLGGFLLNQGGLNRTYGGLNPGRRVTDEALRQAKFEQNANSIRQAPFQEENVTTADRRGKFLMKMQKPDGVNKISWTEPDKLEAAWRVQNDLAREHLAATKKKMAEKLEELKLLKAVRELLEIEELLKEFEAMD